MNIHKERNLKKLAKMLENGEITQVIHDKAVQLEKEYKPYIFKKTASGKINGVNDIFANMQKEAAAKKKRKKKS
jgi:hypothetical protein